MSRLLTRRNLLLVASGVALAGCDRTKYLPPAIRGGLVGASDVLTMATHRLLQSGQPLAPEYAITDLSLAFPTWGETNPQNEDYQRHKANGFRDWRLPVTGLVERPLAWSLENLMRLPRRTQITSHNCEQGWTAIGQWTGAALLDVIRPAGLLPSAKYVVIDTVDEWYEAIDMFDVVHPQTILAYGMNGKELPLAHGAPVRLRLERHMGYKHLKFLKSIRIVESVADIGAGKGGTSGDYNWHWFAGA